MASGYKSLHPMTEELLRILGIPSSAVTQGYGSAKASAGFHEPETTPDGKVAMFGGRRYSSCFDLAFDAVTDDLRDKLVAAAVCVFPRYPGSGWSGSEHVHCVQVGLTNDAGKCTIRSGPRQQILDYTRKRNGLANHGPWEGKWGQSGREMGSIAQAYIAWVPDVATQVVFPDGMMYRCSAWIEGSKVFCEVRRFCDVLRARILDSTGAGLMVRRSDGTVRTMPLAGAYLAGEFLRASVRDLARGFGLKCEFEWAKGKASALVRLTEAGK